MDYRFGTSLFVGTALSYSEANTDSSADADSTQAVLGGSIGLVKSASFGVLIPKLTAELAHEMGSDPSDVTAHFVSTPQSASFSISAEAADSDYFNLGGSLVATFSYGLSAYARYEAVVGRDTYTSETFDLGGRWSF